MFFFKYLLEGLAVALAAYFIPSRKIDPQGILMIALTAGATLALLDLFSPGVALGARQGSGFGIGYRLTQRGGYPKETYLGIDNLPYNLVR